MCFFVASHHHLKKNTGCFGIFGGILSGKIHIGTWKSSGKSSSRENETIGMYDNFVRCAFELVQFFCTRNESEKNMGGYRSSTSIFRTKTILPGCFPKLNILNFQGGVVFFWKKESTFKGDSHSTRDFQHRREWSEGDWFSWFRSILHGLCRATFFIEDVTKVYERPKDT